VILVVVEHDRGVMSAATWEALAAANKLDETHALTIGEAADGLVEQIGVFGATTVTRPADGRQRGGVRRW
jgi:electron transfer flavoprotein alpha subunit